MTQTNQEAAVVRATFEAITYTGKKDELGRPEKRSLPKELRKLGYAVHMGSKMLDAHFKDVNEKLDEERAKLTVTEKIDTGKKNDSGDPVFQEVEKFPTVAAKKEFAEIEKSIMEESHDFNYHMIVDEKARKALNDEDNLPDYLFPDIYNLSFLWEDNE